MTKCNEFPKLRGSEKQIAWADKIRSEAIEAAQAHLDKMQESMEWNPTPSKAEAIEIGKAALADAIGETAASVWIDQRGHRGASISSVAYYAAQQNWAGVEGRARRRILDCGLYNFGIPQE